jgi:hypothetical protein
MVDEDKPTCRPLTINHEPSAIAVSRRPEAKMRVPGIALIAAALAVGGWLQPAAAQVKRLDFADVGGALPAGGCQGERVTVTLYGRFLDDASAVIAAGGGLTVRSVTAVSGSETRAELAIAPDAPLGRHSLRVVSKYGVSDPAWFVVGRLPELLETEPNNAPSEAQTVAPPVVLNARLYPAEDVDCFRFHARAGEPLVLAVEAFQLDSQVSVTNSRFVDATLTIYDATGQVVARNQDFHTLDPLIAFRPPRDGEYVAEVRDMSYLGGESAIYRLTLAAAPWATSLYPAGGRRGTSVAVSVSEANPPVTGAPAASSTTCLELSPTANRILTVAPMPGMANTRPFLVSDLPETLETEPNDSPAQANPVTLPLVFNGRIEHPGDVDFFRITLAKGESIVVDVLAGRVLRSPVDLALSILAAGGKELAQNDDSPYTFEATANRQDSLSGDPRLEFTAPDAGEYAIRVRDIGDRGGPDCVYRATVTRRTPGFSLTTWYDNPQIKGPGATGVILAQLQRYGGFAGPVKLRIGGLPPGWTSTEAVFAPASQPVGDGVVLTLTAPPDARLGTVAPFWIEGEALVDGQPLTVRAAPIAHMNQNSDHGVLRPSDTCIACVVAPEDFRIYTETRSVRGTPGQTVPIPLTLEHEPAYSGNIILLALRGSRGRNIVYALGPPVTVPQNAATFAFPLAIPKDLKPGDYSFVVCPSLAGDYRGTRPHTSTPVITLTVTPPADAPAEPPAGR